MFVKNYLLRTAYYETILPAWNIQSRKDKEIHIKISQNLSSKGSIKKHATLNLLSSVYNLNRKGSFRFASKAVPGFGLPKTGLVGYNFTLKRPEDLLLAHREPSSLLKKRNIGTKDITDYYFGAKIPARLFYTTGCTGHVQNPMGFVTQYKYRNV